MNDKCLELVRDFLIDMTGTALNSYVTFEDGYEHFNDRIWRQNDEGGFSLVRRARKMLKLKPLAFRVVNRAVDYGTYVNGEPYGLPNNHRIAYDWAHGKKIKLPPGH